MDFVIEVGYSDFNLCNEPVCLIIFCDIQLNCFLFPFNPVRSGVLRSRKVLYQSSPYACAFY